MKYYHLSKEENGGKMTKKARRIAEALSHTSHFFVVTTCHTLALCVPIDAGFSSGNCDQGSVLSTSTYVLGCFKLADRQSFLESHLKS